MYKVKDLVYENRHVPFKDGCIVKFLNQMAEVPDHHISSFKTSDFNIHGHTEDEPKEEIKEKKLEEPKSKKKK